MRYIISILIIITLTAGGVWFFTNKDTRIDKTVEMANYSAETITAPTNISTSTKYYKLEAQLPDEDLRGSQRVRNYIQAQVDQFIQTAKEEAPKLSGNMQNPIQFTLNIETITTTTDKLTSYRINTYRFSGGATTDSRVKTFVFNSDGEELNPSEVINSKKQKEFLSAIQDAVYKKYDINPEDKNNPFVAVEDVKLDELNLYVTEGNIHVLFSKYEIAPGAAGVVEVIVPAREFLSSELIRS